MKKIIFILICLMVVSVSCFAFPNEPEGFRGMKWGDSVGRLIELHPNARFDRRIPITANDDTVLYSVYTSNDTVSNVPVDPVVKYGFHDNKLVEVSFTITDYDRFRFIDKYVKITGAMVDMYGKAHDGGKYKDNSSWTNYILFWKGETVNIMGLFKNPPMNSTEAHEGYVLMTLKSEDDRKNAIINAAKADSNKQGW